MSKLRIYGDTSGYIDVAAPATADNSTLDLSKVVKGDASGNVGIGTSSPTKPLHVYGNSSNNHQIRLQNDFGSGSDWTLNAYGANGTLYIGNTADRVVIDSAGRVTMPYQPYFFATQPSTLSMPDVTEQKIQFTYQVTDIGNNYDNTNARFIAPVDGVYQFNVSVYCYFAFAVNVIIKVNNGARNYRFQSNELGGDRNPVAVACSIALNLSASDYVEVWAQPNSSSGNNINFYHDSGSATSWNGYLLG